MSTPVSPQQSPLPEDTNSASVQVEEATVSTGTGSIAISAPAVEAGAGAYSPLRGRMTDLWRLFTGNPKALAGLCIVLFFVLVAIVGPFFVHHAPNAFSSDTL